MTFSSKLTLSALVVLIVSLSVSGEETATNKLLLACLGPDDGTSAVRAALEEGADINARDPTSGQTALMGSVLRGKAATVDLLLKEGADATIPEKDGYTPPHGAAFQGRTQVMRVLKNHNVAKQEYHTDGYLPFHRACWGRTERHSEFIAYMLESGIIEDSDVKSTSGKTCRDMTQNKSTLEVLDRLGSRPEGEL